MPETTIHIERWKYVKVVTDRGSYLTEATMFELTPAYDSDTTTRETVEAVFALENQLAFPRTRGSASQVLPSHLKVTFVSLDGAAWRPDSWPEVIAFNLLKSGGIGKLADVAAVWVPKELRALSNRPDSPAMKWINTEYPR